MKLNFLPLAAAVDVAFPLRFPKLLALLLAAVPSALFESSSLVSSRDSSSSLVDGLVFVVDAAFIGVAFFFGAVVVVSAVPFDSSSSSIGR